MQPQNLKSALIGDWQGEMQLFMAPPPEPGLTSASTLAVTSIAGGSFLQLHSDWSHDGEIQTGVLMFGYDEKHAASAARAGLGLAHRHPIGLRERAADRDAQHLARRSGGSGGSIGLHTLPEIMRPFLKAAAILTTATNR